MIIFFRIDEGPNASMPPQRCETAIVAAAAAVGARDATVSGLWYCFILFYFIFHQRPRWHRLHPTQIGFYLFIQHPSSTLHKGLECPRKGPKQGTVSFLTYIYSSFYINF
jgi:hypothetical protein